MMLMRRLIISCLFFCGFSVSVLAGDVEKGMSLYKQGQYEEALEVFSSQESLKSVRALNMLGYMYDRGLGCNRDVKKANEYYQKAAQAGYSTAQYNLGLSYVNGVGVEKNTDLAQEWLYRAAMQEYGPAEWELGYMALIGRDVKKNYTTAFNWFKRASEHGVVRAHADLGQLYEKGLGTKKNISQAIVCYEKGASLGDSTAQLYLAQLYSKGGSTTKRVKLKNGKYRTIRATSKSSEKALYWYKMAAGNGNKQAMLMLASFYEKGLMGLEKDEQAAQSWRSLAGSVN